jgi:hypothetical protein
MRPESGVKQTCRHRPNDAIDPKRTCNPSCWRYNVLARVIDFLSAGPEWIAAESAAGPLMYQTVKLFEKLGLSGYARRFAQYCIDFSVLSDATGQDLPGMFTGSPRHA